jgi:hypothetical protein
MAQVKEYELGKTSKSPKDRFVNQTKYGMNDAAKDEYSLRSREAAMSGDSSWGAMSEAERVGAARKPQIDAANARNGGNSGGNDGGSQQVASAVESGPSAGDTLASITREQLKHYLETYGDMEEGMLADTDSTALIDSAKESQALGQQVSAGMQQRTMSRYGASMTPAQMAASKRMNSLGNASSYSGAVNNSVLDQRDRNLGLKSSLMGMGNEQLNTALDGLGSAAGMEASREAAYQRDKANAHASNMNMLGQIIGFGMGF